jgi:hypothetical protein
MTKRRRVAVVHALLALVVIVALALATTWALLAIGEGTAAIKLREYGAEFTFGGTFALFIGLMGVFVKTFKNLIHWLIVVLLSVFLSSNFQQMLGGETKNYRGFLLIDYHVLYMTLLFAVLAIVVWMILKRWRWE